MRAVGRPGGPSEGRRGSRFELEEGGRYLGIPQTPGQPAPQPVTINPVSTKSRAKQLALIHKTVFGRSLEESKRLRLVREFRCRVDARLAARPFVAGMPRFIERRAHELPLFVVSGVPELTLRAEIVRRGPGHLFHGIKGAPRTKPLLLREILAEYGWAPPELAYVGDSRYDHRVAVETGLAFIGRVPARRPNPFPADATAVVRDMDELDRRWPCIVARLGAAANG